MVLAHNFGSSAQAALSSENSSARKCGLRGKLEAQWQNHCSMIRHDEQPQIQFDRMRSRQMFQVSRCFKLGLCTCRNAPRENLHAKWFHDNILRIVKRTFASKPSEKTAERKLLEASCILIGLQRQPPNEEDSAWENLQSHLFVRQLWSFS